MKSLSIGAEATVYRNNNYIVKIRTPKKYRISEIDTSIRKSRTKLEKMLLKRIEHLDISPKIHDMSVLPEISDSTICLDEKYAICMEHLEGETLKEAIIKNSTDASYIISLLSDVYKCIGQLHGQQIVHGDLTPNNVLLCSGKVKIIDLGLGKISNKIEDSAVDLYVFERTIMSLAGIVLESMSEAIEAAYINGNVKKGKETLGKLKEVRRRGRKRELNAVG
ncbi:TP53 regulating kinase [Nematocida parisii]|uniref:non-specific serine/threonine protein kinase n=1 Tax=Nematocida parisii (strain ERTm3) TaxID=935791 RepID=I3EKH0_NEMP3|nr:BUD32 protein kinase [Nematocida parisii ERTm1]EIJ89717.1 BUD32 protein kinase [Nematocida parisii ERTm3]KAI5129711.1 TP53 regulating kinase [Nematocida parisii]EIJ94080.1 BUD32 protein kinase [Nematocida parisii ERTm1]KAI5129760.1 TP53 regulating kinase [Nematocida parisii]KAI5142822.1 TP53 regulating kinase [Nematocida parisii]|eukprot:XP_013058576.1 BUD32 protein kinase [Nematocida parisii ERTm1]